MQSLENQISGMSIHPIQEMETTIETIIDGFVDFKSIFVNLPFQETNQGKLF